MATQKITHIAASGTADGTYHAHPADLVTYSLAAWLTNRVALNELAAPNLGMYSGGADDSKGYDWLIFFGSAQPLSADESIAEVRLAAAEIVATINADATQMQMQTDAATAANALSPGATSTETWTVVTDSPTQLVIGKAVS